MRFPALLFCVDCFGHPESFAHVFALFLWREALEPYWVALNPEVASGNVAGFGICTVFEIQNHTVHTETHWTPLLFVAPDFSLLLYFSGWEFKVYIEYVWGAWASSSPA